MRPRAQGSTGGGQTEHPLQALDRSRMARWRADPKIDRCGTEWVGVIRKLPQPHVAGTARHASDLAGVMVVVDVLRRRLHADGADTALLLDQRVEVLRSEPERAPEMRDPALQGPALLAVRRVPVLRCRVAMPVGVRLRLRAAGTPFESGRRI